MTQLILLVSTAVIIASLHMFAPDHWLPLTTIAARRKYGPLRSAGIAAILGWVHGALSSLLAFLVLFVGVIELHEVSAYLQTVTYGLLFAIAGYFLVAGLREDASKKTGAETSVLAISVLPDPAFVPIVLAAYNLSSLGISLIFFAIILVSGFSLIIVVEFSRRTLGKKLANIKARYYDYAISASLIFVAFFLILVG